MVYCQQSGTINSLNTWSLFFNGTISWYVAGTGCSSAEHGCDRVSWRWGFRFGWCLWRK
ncbi:hypothetical protein Hanom_Chr15g01350751 [Helianthus anomalus]